MYCPNCGKDNSVGQRFCRACGMSLQAVSHALAEHLGETALPPTGRRQEKLERWGKIVGITGFALLLLMFIGVFISLLASKLFGLNIDYFFNSVMPVLVSIALPMLVLGAGMAISPRLIKELFSGRSSSRGLTAIQGAPTAAITVVVDPEQAPSITEGTTAHLDMRNGNPEERASRDTHPVVSLGSDQ